MTRIVYSKKPMDMEKVIRKLLAAPDPGADTPIKDWAKFPLGLASYYLIILRQEHDWGNTEACKQALALACAANLPVRAVDWLLSPPRNIARTGNGSNYKKNHKQRLRDMLVHIQVCKLIETYCKYCERASLVIVNNKWKCTKCGGGEQCIVSTVDACGVLADKLREKGESASASGLYKAYLRHMKSTRIFLPDGFSRRTWLTERELGWGK